MLTRIVHLSINAEHRSAFEAYVAQKISVVAAQPGCLSAEWLRATDGTYFTYSRWSAESFLEDYRKSETFAEIWPTLKAWFAAPARAWSCDTLTPPVC